MKPDKFIVTCPKCKTKFNLDDDVLYVGGATSSEITIFIECSNPDCDYEEES